MYVTLADISPGGVGVIHNWRRMRAAECQVGFAVPDQRGGERWIKARCRASYERRLSDHPGCAGFFVGLEFVDIDARERAVLDAFLSQMEATAGEVSATANG